jgi:hypothetical protein
MALLISDVRWKIFRFKFFREIFITTDRLGTGQWQWVGGSSRRERGISGEDVKWMQFSPWKGLVESPGWYQCDREVTTQPSARPIVILISLSVWTIF